MNKPRLSIAALFLSATGLVGIVLHEDYTDRAIQPVAGDKWTNGFGATTRDDGSPVRPGDTTTPPKALKRALSSIYGFEGAVKQCVKVPLTQGEYDSAISLAFNVGSSAFCKSTMVRHYNAGRYAEACAEFDRWTFYQGKDCRIRSNGCYGLVTRRAAERKQCEGG